MITSWKNFIFFRFEYSDGELLYAYEAGKQEPCWIFNPNKIVEEYNIGFGRITFQVIEDVIYSNVKEHIFGLNPKDGKLLWYRNLAKDLGLKFSPDFFGGGLELATFTKSKNILIISFERRIVAIDISNSQYLWHLEPDTFPHQSFPAIYNEKLFITSGDKRKLIKMK